MAEPATAVPAAAGSGRALAFSKMHGAGNDFVVLDRRCGAVPPSPELCRAMADRHTGVGCDQILTVEDAQRPGALAGYRIWNADGSPAGQCGNGARCVAAWVLRDVRRRGDDEPLRFHLDSPSGRHEVEALGNGGFRIALGVPRFEPAAVPLTGFDAPRERYVIAAGGSILEVGAVSMGNPHAVIEVDDIDSAGLEVIGPRVQGYPGFPDSANVGFVQLLAPNRIRLRVYERGVGETLACGSGACAAVAVLVRRGRLAREAAVELPGGTLQVAWPSDGAPMTMAGPAEFVFEGEWAA
ncbi:diaminopimelate epimerase [Lysobacter sp. GX 14042]|uniref:diaminopimelate epimerase n=1 Tax=Lysobacter sp. GX 14042 TaxID=2907155 RepID=UPI001F3F0C3D|nr:diaminopimelate epimerase [Lysobacter sp. GX 14042]MCE7032070.1 diaminopimelate epimerase [Lysobacter sp. GX 14042]